MKTETVKTIIIIVLAGLSILIYLDDICKVEWIPDVCLQDTILISDTLLDPPITTFGECDNSKRYPPTGGTWTELGQGGKRIKKVMRLLLLKIFIMC